jgi:hypothetical protein
VSQGFAHDYLVKATGDSEVTKFLTPITIASGSDAATFTIPAGVKKFSMMARHADLDSTTDIRIQVGGVSGLVTSAYRCSSTRITTTSVASSDEDAAFEIHRTGSSDDFNGVINFELLDPTNHVWSMTANGSDTSGATLFITSGTVDIGEELTTVTFDPQTSNWDGANGKVSCSYENPELAVSGIATTPAGVTDSLTNGTVQATDSGTTKDFPIPSGVKRIVMSWVDTGTSVTAYQGIRLGDASGVKTTGYDGAFSWLGTAGQTTLLNADKFTVGSFGSAQNFSGQAVLTLHDAATNTWVCTGQFMTTEGTDYTAWMTGHIVLDSELTTIQAHINTGVYNQGDINIQYDTPDLDLGSGVISGGVVQTVNVHEGNLVSCPTSVPGDDTIPTNTEGDEVMTCSITPTDVANKLRIDVVCNLHHVSGGSGFMMALLFQDAISPAIAGASQYENVGTASQQVTFTKWMDAGTTDSTTFKVRCGNDGATDLYLNGWSASGRLFGGILASTITITEYKA